MIHIHPVTRATALGIVLMLFGLGLQCENDLEETGNIDARVLCHVCQEGDSVYATAEPPEGGEPLAIGGCCCPSDTCSARMSNLPMGSYRVSFLVPDSAYHASGGAGGSLQNVGYYGEAGLVDSTAATLVTVSPEQPDAVIRLGVGGE